MPGRDGTGPLGDGRMGRGLGPCGKRRQRNTLANDLNDSGSRNLIGSGAGFFIWLIKSIMDYKSKNKRS
ncbi:MAG: DUF5320 domain-containing protein [Candidatus Cloacimonadaceae bacterium]|jgi:hypothetical protein|nr:DUF5320 domain-containing protein [Candidatus Cloacimonadota bacterium]MDX9949615.1 DUF5320 domain-containing protein [Candidatus Syntrophosphaera sp.]